MSKERLEEINKDSIDVSYTAYGDGGRDNYRVKKMVCRDCGNETEENKLFCSEACKKSYMEYLNNSIQKQEQ